jgi:hypothetical protein
MMEKSAKAVPKDELRHLVQPDLHERKRTPSSKDIRRQLGWDLIEMEHKDSLK